MKAKKWLSILCIATMTSVLLSGCGKQEDNTTAQNTYNIARVMLASLDEHEEADTLTWYREPEEVGGYLADIYQMEDIPWLDGTIVRMEGARAFELAVLFVNEEDTGTVTEAMQEYLTNRRAAFTGYFPDQAGLVDNSLILTRGQCVALAVCSDPGAARTYFETCFGDGINARGIPAMLSPAPEDYRPDGRLIYIDPQTDDMTLFDHTAILSAWESGDDSPLSGEEKEVLDAAMAVLAAWTALDMSGYEKDGPFTSG